MRSEIKQGGDGSACCATRKTVPSLLMTIKILDSSLAPPLGELSPQATERAKAEGFSGSIEADRGTVLCLTADREPSPCLTPRQAKKPKGSIAVS